MNQENKKYFGRYRAKVVQNIDPKREGRLFVQIPDVLGSSPCVWAKSANPLAGTEMGVYLIPPINAGVWVEFEQGDPEYPIWVGSFRGSSTEVPSSAQAPPPTNPPIVIQSESQNRIIISSTPGEGIALETASAPAGPMIRIDATGITITDGKGGTISISGGVVTINSGALVVK